MVSLNYILIIAIWIVAVIGIKVMKKLEPDNKAYQALALTNAVMVTAVCLLNEIY